jgi:2-polyprenyl-3-methyl-5-hydroxy-6-metoxy-1,4-benzoquinol methylase
MWTVGTAVAREELAISRHLQSAIEGAKIPADSKILDAPTGYGRHAHWLSKLGYQVVAVDWDADRIEIARRTAPKAAKEIVWMVANLEEHNSVGEGGFDAMVCIHYFSKNIVYRAHEALKPGGVLIMETFGGQGGNWRGLPPGGWIAESIAGKFHIILLDENRVGPSRRNASIKLIARKAAPA